jgi:hypothetical protein
MATSSPTPTRIRSRLVTAAAVLTLAVAAFAVASAPAGAAGRNPAVGSAVALAHPGTCSRTARASSAHRRHIEARRLRRCHNRSKEAAPAASGPLYWGAWIGDQLTGDQAPWDMGAVSKFEDETDKPVSMINFSSPFADCSSSPCSFYKFPREEMDSIRSHGSIPFFSWASNSTPTSLNEPNFQLSDVIAGTHDAYIREFAEAAKSWGHPFFLRFNWEMNGGWFPWSEGVNGNQAGEYVAAWRHVHDIFTSVGATNATWVWCPNVDPDKSLQDLASLYPGDEYVDWTGLDGYNFGTNPARSDHWRTFGQLYSSTYKKITEMIAPSKPLIVSEVGSSEYGGSKATWIEEMLKEVPVDFPKIRGLLWFDKYDDGMDWPIESSSSATSAFASGIQSSAYLGNSFGSAGPGTIQPVS